MVTVLITIGVIWFLCSLFNSASDAIDGTDTKTTFEELCKVSTVITVTSWLGGAHATNEHGKRISVPQGFPPLISAAAKYGLYPTTCDVDGGMMTLVKKTV